MTDDDLRPSTVPATTRGRATRAKILVSAEVVFADLGYDQASIVKITEHAGVGQGTFYLYFESKAQVFDELVKDLGQRVREAMTAAGAGASPQLEAVRLGFAAFFRFTAENPALYRIIRQAEVVSPGALERHYSGIVDGYVAALTTAREAGEIGTVDAKVAAWVLMGITEMVGMRWVLWGDSTEVPTEVFDQVMAMVSGALGAPASTTRTTGRKVTA